MLIRGCRLVFQQAAEHHCSVFPQAWSVTSQGHTGGSIQGLKELPQGLVSLHLLALLPYVPASSSGRLRHEVAKMVSSSSKFAFYKFNNPEERVGLYSHSSSNRPGYNFYWPNCTICPSLS